MGHAGLARPSSREPARTYAAMETEREPGRRAEITRGPSASTVRWNIAVMVARTRRTGGRPRGVGPPVPELREVRPPGAAG